jgi:hypothetical protein
MNLFERKLARTRRWAGISLVLSLYVLLGSSGNNASLCLGHRLLAQISTQTSQAPSGWFLTGSKPKNYRTGVEKTVIHEGRPSAYLLSATSETDGFGTLMQSVDAENYTGKRLRLRASVKSQDVAGWAGMWMRVDKERTVLAFDNMQNRGIAGTQPWNTYDVVLDVPVDATNISFGILLSGAGEVWINHVTLETVGKETQVTGSGANQKAPLSKVPVNLDFSD